ncbi:Hypothetical_protein [Hexamita inflata]|uniref:Hypothetical_protein n=1 Tax=Hexamita inflata TaxID=28002 RepID=A0AA86NQ00_9EUKA|nr:Hypothetical protein HINF_LOCUS12027 [Hexamita inflata]
MTPKRVLAQQFGHFPCQNQHRGPQDQTHHRFPPRSWGCPRIWRKIWTKFGLDSLSQDTVERRWGSHAYGTSAYIIHPLPTLAIISVFNRGPQKRSRCGALLENFQGYTHYSLHVILVCAKPQLPSFHTPPKRITFSQK